MAPSKGAHCIVLSPEDRMQLAKFYSLLIDIDRRLQHKKRLIAKIAWIITKIAETQRE